MPLVLVLCTVDTFNPPSATRSAIIPNLVQSVLSRLRGTVRSTRSAAPTAPLEVPRAGRPGYLFIAGCERTGTTALLDFLNSDHRFILGRERFKFACSELTPDHFSKDRFFNPTSEETNFLNADFYGRLRKRWQSDELRYIGDKNPLYFRHLSSLAETFPHSRFVITLRNLERVAASFNARARNPEDKNWPEHKDYRKAVKFWNQSLSNARRLYFNGGKDRIMFLRYENFFAGDKASLTALFEFLGLHLTPEGISRFATLTENWPAWASRPLDLQPHELQYLERKCDRALETWCLERCL